MKDEAASYFLILQTLKFYYAYWQYLWWIKWCYIKEKQRLEYNKWSFTFVTIHNILLFIVETGKIKCFAVHWMMHYWSSIPFSICFLEDTSLTLKKKNSSHVAVGKHTMRIWSYHRKLMYNGSNLEATWSGINFLFLN